MPQDYLEKEELYEKAQKILKNQKQLEKAVLNEIEYEFMVGSKHGGQYLHTTKAKVRAKIETEKLIKIIEEKLNLPLTTNQKLKIKELGKYIEAISEDERSQLKNKKIATERLIEKIKNLIEKLYPKPRITESKESKEAEDRRIKEKKIKSSKKELRRKII